MHISHAARGATCCVVLTCLVSALTVSGAAAPQHRQRVCRTTDKGGGDSGPDQYQYKVRNVYPHDPKAFTEGLIADHGSLYESTGRYGESEVRRVDVHSGEVIQRKALDAQHFGEGITDYKGQLVQLTYKDKQGFIYDKRSLEETGEFSVSAEGWGLTSLDDQLIMSDGSSTLYSIDPETSRQKPLFQVTENGRKVDKINELETVDGCIYANIFHSDRIIKIDPRTGKVISSVDMTGLNPDPSRPYSAVLNGIAFDARTRKMYVTGKLWNHVYEVTLKKVSSSGSTAPSAPAPEPQGARRCRVQRHGR